MLKRNVLANVLSGLWNIFLNLAVIPVQIRFLGVEAYGLIAFMTSVQLTLAVADAGLSLTMIREIAADRSPEREVSRELARTAATFYHGVGLAVFVGLMLGADWIALHWLNSETLSPEYVAGALRLMALSIILNWWLNIYVSILSGLQRLDIVSLLRFITRTIILGGGVGVLLLSGDFYTFLLWMAASSLVALLAHLAACRHLLGGFRLQPYFSMQAIRQVWRRSLELNLVSVLSVIFAQADRWLIGSLLPLALLGYYNAAYSLAYGLTSIQLFITAAVLPALAADHERQEADVLAARYTKFVQILLYVIGLPTFVLMFFGRDALTLWVGAEIAQEAYGPMAILAFGFLVNALAAASYTLGIATGTTRVLLYVNAAALLIYLPLLTLLTLRLELNGAALAWVGLNLYYVTAFLFLLHKRFIPGTVRGWLRQTVMPYLVLAALFALGQAVSSQPGWRGRPLVWLIYAACGLGYAASGFFFIDRGLRQNMLLSLRRYWRV